MLRTQTAMHQIIPDVNSDQRNANQKCDFFFLYLLHWRDKDPSLGSISLRPSPDPPAVNQLEHCRSRSTLLVTQEVQLGTHGLASSG